MDIFDLLTMLGGLSLFLFGMNVMGQALERRAGSGLRTLLGKLTGSPIAGLLTGLGVTAVIQSSSATTVMVVGFVNSGLMELKQAIYVIMGANVGTTVTAWILSLAGVSSGNFWVQMLKPSSFTPILGVIGTILYMAGKSDKKRDTGTILLGFATLMFGMETMSGAVSGLGEVPAFQRLFVAFQNPLLGVLAGAVLTAIIQSSSASVGILQALAVTGQVSYRAAIPIIMGQNIGTCATALLSSVGANRNAKRAATVHLLFNVIGTGVWLTVFCLLNALLAPAILSESASLMGIAVCHSVFNVLCTILLVPMAGLLEKLVCLLVPEGEEPEQLSKLDERLLATPSVALERCQEVATELAELSVKNLWAGLSSLTVEDTRREEKLRERESRIDHYEDILSTYLVRLSASSISQEDNAQAAKLLRMIGDFERIGDHGLNLLKSAEALRQKKESITEAAKEELAVVSGAIEEILTLTMKAFLRDDLTAAVQVEPLEEVVNRLKKEMRSRHIHRMQKGECALEIGFIWSDILNDLERTADHCSNIAACVSEMAHREMNVHESVRELRSGGGNYREQLEAYRKKYQLTPLD